VPPPADPGFVATTTETAPPHWARRPRAAAIYRTASRVLKK
jgi:hypothetical protein